MKLKKILVGIIVFSLSTLNLSPALAIIGIKDKTKNTNKQSLEDTIIDYVNLPWWQEYNDDYLEAYIEKAIKNNYDLKIATLKVEMARQNVKAQFASELPNLTVGASPAISKLPASTQSEGFFTVPIIASYEIDIFLKNHDKTKSVKKMYETSKLDEKSSYISIISTVGATYYNIVKADKLIDLQREIVKDRKDIYELMKLRNEEGITSTSDLVKSEKEYILADSNLSELDKLRTNLLTSLAVLIGDSPDNINEYKRISYDNLKIQKQIPLSISSEIIVSRPDYLVAEKMIEKAGIDVRVAKKEFLPSFNIGGLMALMTTSNGGAMNWENSLAGVGIMGLLPVFTGGKKIANLKIYKNKYEQALQNYQKTNLTAIKEVNDSLSNLKFDKIKYDKNLEAYNMEKKDFHFSQKKYNEGVISYLDLIQKKETLLTTQKLVVSGNIDTYINQISLYKATAAGNL